MSDTNPPQGVGQQPTEEEMRAYLQELRDTPVGQVITEVLSVLLNAAQVKLGRHDGRLVLDVVALINDTTAPALPEEIVTQVRDALAQLRLAQVEGEKQRDPSEPNDLAAPIAVDPPASGQTAPPAAGSRLWTPS